MISERSVFIVLGPPPISKKPIGFARLQEIAQLRSDVALRVGETGTKVAKDWIVYDPNDPSIGPAIFMDGRVKVLNPNKETIGWMIRMAEALGGRVVDNTGRTYRTPTEKFIHPDDVESRKGRLQRIKEAESVGSFRWPRFIGFLPPVLLVGVALLLTYLF